MIVLFSRYSYSALHHPVYQSLVHYGKNPRIMCQKDTRLVYNPILSKLSQCTSCRDISPFTFIVLFPGRHNLEENMKTPEELGGPGQDLAKSVVSSQAKTETNANGLPFCVVLDHLRQSGCFIAPQGVPL